MLRDFGDQDLRLGGGGEKRPFLLISWYVEGKGRVVF